MSQGPLILWLLAELWGLYLTPTAAETVVTAFLGQSVTLPCVYPSWSTDSNSMCWGKGACPNSKCNEELLHTNGVQVLSRRSAKYNLQGAIRRGNVSLTISNTNEGDSSMYCCRIEVPGWFNDVKKNILLQLRKAPTTTRRPTTITTTTLPTTTTTLPATVATTPDLTTRTSLQTSTTSVLTEMTTTCPLTTSSSPPETAEVLPTTEPSMEEPMHTAETETLFLPEATTQHPAFLTSTGSKGRVLQSTSPALTWKIGGSVGFSQPKGSEMTTLGQHQIERKQISHVGSSQISHVGSSHIREIMASSLGLVLCACVLTIAFLLRGKVRKTNCFRKHTRLGDAGESNKNILDDMQHGREDEDGLFTL